MSLDLDDNSAIISFADSSDFDSAAILQALAWIVLGKDFSQTYVVLRGLSSLFLSCLLSSFHEVSKAAPEHVCTQACVKSLHDKPRRLHAGSN